MHKQHLYEARTGGYHTCRIPVLAVAPGGTVLAACEARTGKGGDYDGNDLLLRRSHDGGQTFDEPVRLVAFRDYGPGPISNLVLIPDAGRGCVHGLFCHDYNRVFYIRSDDEGARFSEPREISQAMAGFREAYPWVVCATGPGHGVRHASGRLIVPVWLSDGSAHDFGPSHRGHRPSNAATIYSDDGGATWHAGAFAACHDEPAADGRRMSMPSEAALAELADGRVMINMRSQSDAERRLVSISPDGVGRWQTPWFDAALVEPVCLGSLLGLPDGTLLFTNPANLENDMVPPGGNLAHDRKRLTVFLSRDHGRTWCASRVLEAGPAGYSHLARLPDGRIGCLYEDDIVERMADDRYVTLARFELDEVDDEAAGKD